MKAFERIFLYSVLAVLVIYVFLVDSNVEGKVAIQEEIRAKSISIMNNAGQKLLVYVLFKMMEQYLLPTKPALLLLLW